MKKFICIRGWRRDEKGAIVEEWLYNKYPEEVKIRNFKEYLPESVVEVEEVKQPEPKLEEEKPSPRLFGKTHRGFNVEDTPKVDGD